VNIMFVGPSQPIKGLGYTADIILFGGFPPYTVKVSAGQLPPGLVLSATSNYPNGWSLGGIPTNLGVYQFTLEARDSGSPPVVDTEEVTLTVVTQMSIVTDRLPDGERDQPYTGTVEATGGVPPYIWSALGLPDGLEMDPYTGTISGIPTIAMDTQVVVIVHDSGSIPQRDDKGVRLNIIGALRIDTTSLFDGLVDGDYTARLFADGGTPPYRWSLAAGSLPPGLRVTREEYNLIVGRVEGHILEPGTFDFTVRAEDSNVPPQVDEQDYRIEVIGRADWEVISWFLPAGLVGFPYSAFLSVDGGVPPYTWAISQGSLPSGLILDAANGEIHGTPDTPGAWTFQAQVLDAGGYPPPAAGRWLTLRVQSVPPGRNDSIATATPLSNGSFFAAVTPYADPPDNANPDTDYYRLTATAAAVVTIEVNACNIVGPDNFCSLMDPVVEIVDENGARFATCRDPADDNAPPPILLDPTPQAFDDVCLNDDAFPASSVRSSKLEFQVPGTAAATVTFYVHVLDWRGLARPDLVYEIKVSGAN